MSLTPRSSSSEPWKNCNDDPYAGCSGLVPEVPVEEQDLLQAIPREPDLRLRPFGLPIHSGLVMVTEYCEELSLFRIQSCRCVLLLSRRVRLGSLC